MSCFFDTQLTTHENQNTLCSCVMHRVSMKQLNNWFRPTLSCPKKPLSSAKANKPLAAKALPNTSPTYRE